MIYLADTPQKVDNIHRATCFAYLVFLLCSLSQKFSSNISLRYFFKFTIARAASFPIQYISSNRWPASPCFHYQLKKRLHGSKWQPGQRTNRVMFNIFKVRGENWPRYSFFGRSTCNSPKFMSSLNSASDSICRPPRLKGWFFFFDNPVNVDPWFLQIQKKASEWGIVFSVICS